MSYLDDYRKRCDEIIDFFATRDPSARVSGATAMSLAARARARARSAQFYTSQFEFTEIATRLYRRRDLDRAFAELHALLDDPHGDMFWAYPMVMMSYLGQGIFPQELDRRVRESWSTYTPYRGDTENHWLMYYTTVYLMARLYPDEKADGWFNGRSSAENEVEARSYIRHWADETTRIGQGEFDSPHYICFYLAPLALLYWFADESEIKHVAELMITYVLADFAAESLDGLYAGAFSRIYPQPMLERWRNGSTTYAWLLWGNTPFRPQELNIVLPRPGYRPHGTAAILAMSGYDPPEILHRIATDRSKPYLHRERKRTRRRLRYSEQQMVPVLKNMYMTPDYAVGSMQGGLLQPIQQHTWEVLWRTEKPHTGFNVLFTIHPFSSGYELGMYFPEEPKLLTKEVARAEKPTYDRPLKLTGASPHEQIAQAQDAVVALYDIPEGTRFPHILAFFSRTLTDLQEDDSGWIFARGEQALIAYRPLAPYEWLSHEEGHRLLRSSHLKNGAVVQVAPLSEVGSVDAFRERVLALDLSFSLQPRPNVSFVTLRGDSIDVTYGADPVVNGRRQDEELWKLFDGPFLHSELDSRVLDLCHGDERRRLDIGAAVDLIR
jgi:hypothetical protein